jgi:hypothetical protein
VTAPDAVERERDALLRENASLREQLDDIEHETRTSTNLARKYWALWRERGRLLSQARRIGVVLEPFAGSGTTVEASVLEGFRCIGIEREADYIQLIESRLAKPMQQSLFDELMEGAVA